MDADAVADSNSFDISGTSIAALQGFLNAIAIVSIDEAIETLRNYCPNCSPQIALDTLVANKWEVAQIVISGFANEDFKCAIRIFTAEEPFPFYKWTNSAFLNKKRSQFSLRFHAPYVKLLLLAVQELMALPEFAYEGVGYRGLKLDGNAELKRKYLNYHTEFCVGQLMTFPAFMSVSTYDSVADDFGDYVFFVFVKVRGARIARLSQLPKEAEIIVPPPSVFRIKAVAKFGGKLTITLEQESCPLSYLSQPASMAHIAPVASSASSAVLLPFQPSHPEMHKQLSLPLLSSPGASATQLVSAPSNTMDAFTCPDCRCDFTCPNFHCCDLRCRDCHCCDCHACAVDLPPEDFSVLWLCASFEGFFAFFTIPKICSKVLSNIFCFPEKASLKACCSHKACCDDRCLCAKFCFGDERYCAYPCGYCCFCWPLTALILYFPAMLYGCFGRMIAFPCFFCFLVSGMIEQCQQVCCGGRTMLFKIFYYPPMLLASSFFYLWNFFCCARSCFCLGRRPCGPDCQAVHKRVCLVCGQKHQYYQDGKKDQKLKVGPLQNHLCKDGRRGSFAWSMDEGDPMCQC